MYKREKGVYKGIEVKQICNPNCLKTNGYKNTLIKYKYLGNNLKLNLWLFVGWKKI